MRKIKLYITIILIFSCNLVIAENNTHLFNSFGVIDAINNDGRIVVSDTSYAIISQVRIHKGKKSIKTGVQYLRSGMKIGYKLDQSGFISDVWVLKRLPKNQISFN